MKLFDQIITKIIDIEGNYSNNPNDSGGPTKYGITERIARQYGYLDDMKELPLNIAKDIYDKRFWLPLQLDKIEEICPSIVEELLDTGINQGIGRAAEYLQLSLNALNRQGLDYKDIKVDGDIGPATLSALQAYMKKRKEQGEIVLLRALNCLQGSFYINLSQKRQKDEDFLFGWILNRVII